MLFLAVLLGMGCWLLLRRIGPPLVGPLPPLFDPFGGSGPSPKEQPPATIKPGKHGPPVPGLDLGLSQGDPPYVGGQPSHLPPGFPVPIPPSPPPPPGLFLPPPPPPVFPGDASPGPPSNKPVPADPTQKPVGQTSKIAPGNFVPNAAGVAVAAGGSGSSGGASTTPGVG